jgi:hypothetical protein
MSYRNDHEASLLRVDALEAELEVLRLAYERQRATNDAEKPLPKRRSRTAWIVAGAMIALTAGTAIGAVSLFRATAPEEPRPSEPAATTGTPTMADDRTLLRECRDAIVPLADPRTAETTDPHGLHRSVAQIAETGAPCRRLLADADHLAIDPTLRAAVVRWSQAEDQLIGDITRTMIYYQSDPYAADGYRSAPQLWKEYDRDVTARNAVLRDLDPLL